MSDIPYNQRPRRFVMAFMAGLSAAARMSADMYLMELLTVVAFDAAFRTGEN